jgi:hypothetical protein
MPRVHTAKKSSVGKEITCKRCQRAIKPKETYYYYTRRFSRVGKGVRFNHCSAHRPRPTDLSSSPMAEIREAQEDAQKAIDSASCGADMMSALEDLKSVADDVKTRAEESLENMPEGLRENSDSGQQLQERIDALESYIDELDSVSVDGVEQKETPDEEEEDTSLEDARQECESAIDSLSI